MLTYQQLDSIADSYIPILFVITLYVLSKGISKSGFKDKIPQIGSLALSIGMVYLIMAVDNKLHIWPRFELDYSTHTALALVFVSYLSFSGKKVFILSVLSMFCYAALMIYQNYHSLTDIVTTAIVLLPAFILLNTKANQTKIR